MDSSNLNYDFCILPKKKKKRRARDYVLLESCGPGE